MVLGRSGCGKSTLLNIMGGMIPPSQGRVTFHGEAITKPDPSRILLTQQPTLLPWLTVHENVAFGCRLRKEVDDLEGRVHRSLEMVHLCGYEGYLPSQLSVGMQQRVCMARALVGNPSVLMLDEPFGALDTVTRSRLHHEVIEIRRKNPEITLVFVTHDIDEALALASRVVVLGGDPGHILADFSVASRYPRDPASPELRHLKESIIGYLWEESL